MLPPHVAHLKFRSFEPRRISRRPPTFGNKVEGSYVSGYSTRTTEFAFYTQLTEGKVFKYNFVGGEEAKLYPANLFYWDGRGQRR
jgi:hypothetical protein